MELLGQNYGGASSPLQILLLSLLPAVVASGISVLVYAYGHYKRVLAIGLATNVPRTILYFVLIQMYGNEGAALSYTIGAITGFAISIIVAKRMNFQIYWKDLGLIMVIPAGIGLAMNYFGLNYIVGIVVTIALSYFSDITRYSIKSRTPRQPNYRARIKEVIYAILLDNSAQSKFSADSACGSI
jgi:O-antigen/teichoic acid export membrane protein